MPTREAPNAVAGPSKKNKAAAHARSSKKTSTAMNPRNTEPSKPVTPSLIDPQLPGTPSADTQLNAKPGRKPVTYAKPAKDFQNNRKQKAPKPSRTTQPKGAQPADGLPVLEKKAVFRTTLDNPYHVEWPSISLNVENGVLACVLELLEGVATWSERRDLESRRRKNKARLQEYKTRKKSAKAKQSEPQRASSSGKVGPDSSEVLTSEVASLEGLGRKRKRDHDGDGDSSAEIGQAETEVDDEDRVEGETRHATEKPPAKKQKLSPAEPLAESAENDHSTAVTPILGPDAESLESQRPKILDHTVMGINEVTKRLERQSAALRQPGLEMKHAAVRLVVVCRTDVDSPMMIAHLPMLVAACNSRAPIPDDPPVLNYPDVIMVGLPYGAQETLSAACGLRKVAVMAFDNLSPGLERVTELYLPSIPILKAPWLAVAPASTLASAPPLIPQLVPTHIKQFKTTAPKNMTEAKKRRQSERKAAKEAKKAGATGHVKQLQKVVVSAVKDVVGSASAGSAKRAIVPLTKRKGAVAVRKDMETREEFPSKDGGVGLEVGAEMAQ